MKRYNISGVIIITLFLFTFSYAQVVLPSNRMVEWYNAGLRSPKPTFDTVLQIQNYGGNGNGTVSNNTAINSALQALNGHAGVIEFPSGIFLFSQPIVLSDSVIIRGQGAQQTTLLFNLNGSGNSINISGSINQSSATLLTAGALKGDSVILINNIQNFQADEWIRLSQNDSAFIDYTQWSWGLGNVGQIIQIDTVIGNLVYLKSPLRMDYPSNKNPLIRKINSKSFVGIECLKIDRIDNTAPEQSSNIYFLYAVNSWVSGVELDSCNYAQIDARYSSNLHVSGSYLHHSHEYGGNGRGYGIILNSATGECLVEDNIFNHLRHSMIVQSGANGNVFAYNYSFDPYWTTFPNNSSGDVVCHGTYPYANLFEHNVIQNIVLDNSHGLNGPYNTFFRNRAETYGIFMSSTNSPSQNFIGNTITSSGLGQGQYTLLGTDHFEYGNNHKGTIKPSGTENLNDTSYIYKQKPDFLLSSLFRSIGTPSALTTGTIPAFQRFETNHYFNNYCGNYSLPEVNFENATMSVNEDAGIVSLFFKAENCNPFPISVRIFPVFSGSSDTNDVTVTAPEEFIISANNDLQQIVTFSVNDDAIHENSEYFEMHLTITQNGVTGIDSIATINIIDNDNDVTSISNTNQNSIQIYPNPTNGFFSIHSEIKIEEIRIFNSFGSLIFIQNEVDFDATINSFNWSSGIYLLEIKLLNKTAIQKHKIIKKD